MLAEAKNHIKQDDNVRILIKESDERHISEKEYQIEYSHNIKGGFIMIVNNEVRYDFTIKGRILQNSEYINCMLEKMIEDSSGDKDEC